MRQPQDVLRSRVTHLTRALNDIPWLTIEQQQQMLESASNTTQQCRIRSKSDKTDPLPKTLLNLPRPLQKRRQSATRRETIHRQIHRSPRRSPRPLHPRIRNRNQPLAPQRRPLQTPSRRPLQPGTRGKPARATRQNPPPNRQIAASSPSHPQRPHAADPRRRAAPSQTRQHCYPIVHAFAHAPARSYRCESPAPALAYPAPDRGVAEEGGSGGGEGGRESGDGD